MVYKNTKNLYANTKIYVVFVCLALQIFLRKTTTFLGKCTGYTFVFVPIKLKTKAVAIQSNTIKRLKLDSDGQINLSGQNSHLPYYKKFNNWTTKKYCDKNKTSHSNYFRNEHKNDVIKVYLWEVLKQFIFQCQFAWKINQNQMSWKLL